MTRRHELKLGWAFALALLLHAVVLFAATRLPVAARGGELGQLRVFDAAAPVVVSSVSLVQLAARRPPGAAHQLIAPMPAPTAEELAPAAPGVEEGEPSPAPPKSAPRPASGPRPAQTRPGRTSAPPAVAPTPPASGGGGGAPVAAGPGKSAGTASAASGTGAGAPAGEVPGEGTGGAGAGGGTGSGPGAGQGGGEGAPPASGGGSGDGTGTAAPEAPKHRPTPPDRAEPKLAYKEPPVYPESAAEQGVEGTCTLKVVVGERGEVQSVAVTRSSGDARLDQAAVACVRRWRYRPAVQGGKPHAVATLATVEFALR